MKVIGFLEIDEYKIITAIEEVSADPEATKAEIAKQENIDIDSVVELDNYEELFERYKVPFHLKPNQIRLDDPDAEILEEKKAGLNQNQLLLVTGEILANYVGTEYWRQVNGKWEKQKIERLGEEPAGPTQEELSPEQQEEIRAQEEESRICCMSPEERAEALQRELDALADEAARLEKRAQIQGNVFDTAAWYQEHAAAVREKYSVTEE